MEDLIKKMSKDAEEYAALHGKNCSCMMESPDACDCEEMECIKEIARTAMESVNKYWVEMAKEHRKLCTPEGKKNITLMINRK